jgi:rhodanese-related sulfurtransferase
VGLFSKLFGKGDAERPKPAAAPAPPPERELPPWPEISPAECQERIRAGGVVVLDVRMPQEHEMRRIAGSKLVPVQALRQRIGELDPAATYIVHCEHGMRSADACAFLQHAGFKNLYEMAGGLSAYTGPTERGPVK